MNHKSKIFVAGHNGLVGSAIVNVLRNNGYTNLLLKSRHELDLLDQKAVTDFFVNEKPEFVFLTAAKVGGIHANTLYKGDFIYENLTIQNNVIHSSQENKVQKLLFLGSSCIYPRDAKQPITEDSLLTGSLEVTNEPYAVAKIAGIKLCESYNSQYNTNFISIMPTNLYGPNDNFDLKNSHVIPAIIRKMVLAKWYQEKKFLEIQDNLEMVSKKACIKFLIRNGIYENRLKLWGSGKPLREFLWSEDLADACLFIMGEIDIKDIRSVNNAHSRISHINVGTGLEISILDLAILISKIIGYKGVIQFDNSMPDGTKRKLLDVSKLHNLGWKHSITLEDGLRSMIDSYLKKVSID